VATGRGLGWRTPRIATLADPRNAGLEGLCRRGLRQTLTLAIRNYHNAGSTTIRTPLAALAVLFDRLGRHEPAATIAGFALSPIAAAAVPEIITTITQLRDVLGDHSYESLARKGKAMTTAAMARSSHFEDFVRSRQTLWTLHGFRFRSELGRDLSGESRYVASGRQLDIALARHRRRIRCWVVTHSRVRS
jgi:hypothetical protein